MGNPETKSLILESATAPHSALEIGAMLARVRERISYTVQNIGGPRWKLVLTRGSLEDLRSAIRHAPRVKEVDP